MELLPNKYYKTDRFPNTQYLMMMAIEKYFGLEIFKGDSSRVFYASPEYTFRRRLDMLNANASQDMHSLQIPFMSYYRKTNWEVDRQRRGIESPRVALEGSAILSSFNLRFMNTKATFSAFFVFGRDDEAQIAYETLLWVKHPSAKQFTFPGLAYKDCRLDLPIQLWVDNVVYNPQLKEKDWLQKNRMIVVQADFTLRSVIIAPVAQGSQSSLFETAEEGSGFYITKEAYLDYFSSKNLPLPDEAYYDVMVTGEMSNDPTLTATLTSADITNTSATLLWDFNESVREFYEDTVKITTNTGLTFEAPMDAKTFTLPNLQPASTYDVFLWFYSKQDFINKYNIIITTADVGYKPLTLKTLPGR